jgi:hypothetical protein
VIGYRRVGQRAAVDSEGIAGRRAQMQRQQPFGLEPPAASARIEFEVVA